MKSYEATVRLGSTEDVPTATSPIQAVLHEVAKLQSETSCILRELQERLSPVVRPVPEDACGEPLAAVSSCPLESELRQIKDATANVNHILGALLRGLCI